MDDVAALAVPSKCIARVPEWLPLSTRYLIEHLGMWGKCERVYASSQGKTNQFAVLTGDLQPIHMNPAYARREKLSGTIMHGFHTLSLTPDLISEFAELTEQTRVLIQELNRTKWHKKVPVDGSHLCGRMRVVGHDLRNNSAQLSIEFQILNESDEIVIIGELTILSIRKKTQ